jgi:hypothetical protein
MPVSKREPSQAREKLTGFVKATAVSEELDRVGVDSRATRIAEPSVDIISARHSRRA